MPRASFEKQISLTEIVIRSESTNNFVSSYNCIIIDDHIKKELPERKNSRIARINRKFHLNKNVLLLEQLAIISRDYMHEKKEKD